VNLFCGISAQSKSGGLDGMQKDNQELKEIVDSLSRQLQNFERRIRV